MSGLFHGARPAPRHAALVKHLGQSPKEQSPAEEMTTNDDFFGHVSKRYLLNQCIMSD